MDLSVLISPLTRGAYYGEYLDLARAEFEATFPDTEVEVVQQGGLDFLHTRLPEDALQTLARLSFVQGAFTRREDGALTPLPLEHAFLLPRDLIFGVRYQGKTNELVTQMAINIGLQYCQTERTQKTLLDPMAGRGTTLLWGLRYGLDVTGIEQDQKAPLALHNHIKKQTKLHRLKHSHEKGFVGKKNKKHQGAYAQYTLGGHRLKFITGDSREAMTLLQKQRFDLIVSDLPYGVQFKGETRRNPQQIIEACVDGWLKSLRNGGVMVLIFNQYQPTREALTVAFDKPGYDVQPFTATHRMSESIVRDFFVVRATSGHAEEKT